MLLKFAPFPLPYLLLGGRGVGRVLILTPVSISWLVMRLAMYLSPRPKATDCTRDWCTASPTTDGRLRLSVRCV